jgi:hypothetical protein
MGSREEQRVPVEVPEATCRDKCLNRPCSLEDSGSGWDEQAPGALPLRGGECRQKVMWELMRKGKKLGEAVPIMSGALNNHSKNPAALLAGVFHQHREGTTEAG